MGWVVLPMRGQVSICYDFESAMPNSRPIGWGALPNLDYHYVGVINGVAHTGSKSLCNNGTTCFTIMPDEGLNYGADSVWLTFWYYLHNNTDFFEVGYLTDASDSTTFHVLDTVHEWSQEWHFHAVDLSSVPTGARIAFFGHDMFSSDGTFWLDNIHLTSTPCAAWGLRVAENREDSVRLEWESAGDPTVTVTINWNTDYSVTGNSFTFARNYYNSFMSELIAQCPYSGCMAIQPHSQMYIPRYREGSCLDVTDYNSYSYSTYSSMAVPFYGTPVEPYLHTGTYTTNAPGVTGIYAGSHTINTNLGSEVTSGMMVFPRTIPPGDNVTLRLGNRLGDWESASVLYTIDVDTNVADRLVIKYTVAMAFGSFQGTEEAHRNDTLHPAWFRIEMLDATLSQLQPEGCNLFYIDAWNTAGWDNMNSMYKRRDFTGMAFDLSPYHGQRLHLRVTTCDGAVNNRWCYAYYNLECLKHYDYSYNCSGDSLTFSMPYGFRYRWWKEGETTTLDTNQSITVAADSSLYHCELIDRFNPSCNTMVSRWALSQPQQWLSDSLVENDLPHTFRGITFTTATDTTFLLPSPNGCDTALHYHLHVWPNRKVRLERKVCENDWPIVWEGFDFTGPDSVTFTLVDSHGADSTVTLVAVEAPVYETWDTMVICKGMPFIYDGVDYGGATTLDLSLTSQIGCDSLVHLSLVAQDSAFGPTAYYSLDGTHWYDTVPIALCLGQQLHVRDSTIGAEGWEWGIESGSWSANGEGPTATFTFDTLLQGNLLTLDVETAGGCHDTIEWPVFVFSAPQADFAWLPDKPVDIAPEVQFINNTRPRDCDYQWLVVNDEGVDSLRGFEPVYRWPGELPRGTFDVTLTASMRSTYLFEDSTYLHVCIDSAQHSIEIVTAWLQFPNLVTPNGDGINDRWEVVNLVELGQYSMNELWIYNPWGVLVFHATDIRRHEEFWDPAETHSPDGTYYYRFSAKGAHGLIRCNGIIEVVR